jgi:hypothetical protein
MNSDKKYNRNKKTSKNTIQTGGYTRKNRNVNIVVHHKSNGLLDKFQKEITIVFFEILLMIKLFHWKTHSYPAHKATDELYTSFNGNMDKFIEILLGKTGSRIHLMNQKQIRLVDVENQEKLKLKIESFKSYLVNLNKNPAINSMSNSDLLNIRDEILGNMNQFLYLLTFK